MKDETPWIDPIVEEMRRHGDEYAKKFGYDLDKIVQDLRRQQEESGHSVVSFSREGSRSESSTATSPPTAPARRSKRHGT